MNECTVRLRGYARFLFGFPTASNHNRNSGGMVGKNIHPPKQSSCLGLKACFFQKGIGNVLESN